MPVHLLRAKLRATVQMVASPRLVQPVNASPGERRHQVYFSISSLVPSSYLGVSAYLSGQIVRQVEALFSRTYAITVRRAAWSAVAQARTSGGRSAVDGSRPHPRCACGRGLGAP